MKSNFKIVLFYVILIVGILFAANSLFPKPEEVKYSQIIDYFTNKQVQSFTVEEDNSLVLKLKDGKSVEYRLRSVDLFVNDLGSLILEQKQAGVITEYNYVASKPVQWWVAFIPYLVIIALFVALWFYVMNQSGAGKSGKITSFGKARTKLGSDEKNKVSFADVAGAEEEKEELKEIVDFLKNPQKYVDLGAKIPKGVLLVGPPGTGKTLLAKAVAGEAGVPFLSISGSDFVEMYVGVGASRVRDLFESAKKTAPSIVFIDEIDAVGRHRGAGLGGGHDEREQTLNQLLVEMDGFGNNNGVIVMAATNRPDILDPALLRPGRFDRQVTVNYPDIKGREEILKVHSRGKPFEKDIDLSVLAKTTVGFTGADLANLLNEAAILSARKGKRLIGRPELDEAMIKVIVGPQKKSKVVTEKEKRLTAYHEAGHAVAQHSLPGMDPVHQISIIPSGNAGGYTLSLPKEDKNYASKNEMKDHIVTLLGGRVAEKLVLGDISTGASSDIQRASSIARNMITKYGMSDKLGPIVFGNEHEEVFLGRDFTTSRNYSEKVASLIDEEIKSIIDEAYTRTEQILTENMQKVTFVAEYLIKNEIMDEEQFRLAMQEHATEEELDRVRNEKKEKSRNENLQKLNGEKAGEQSETI